MPLKSTPMTLFRTVGASHRFHNVIRQLAALEEKKMWIVLDAVALPVLEKRLAKLNAKAAK